jgi:electron transfer flavoprotein alpha subunit
MSRLGGVLIGGHPKDFCAPIFGVADYGIVDDFLNVIPVLKEKTKGMK